VIVKEILSSLDGIVVIIFENIYTPKTPLR